MRRIRFGEFLLFCRDELFEDFESNVDQVEALLLFLAQPILKAAFAPARQVGFTDARMALRSEPGDNVFVFLVAHEPETDLVSNDAGKPRDLADAAMVAVTVFGAGLSRRSRGWARRQRG